MKYAFMTFSCPELSLDDALDLAGRLGYDGLEPRVAAGHKHGVELEASADERERIRQGAIRHGVVLCCVAVSCSFSNPETAAEQVALTHRYIDLASDIGVHRVRVFGGNLPQGVEREAAIDLVTRSLSAVADHAAERNIIVCMETHDSWCDPVHVAEVMNRVNHPAIAVNWDFIHSLRRAATPVEKSFGALRPWIRHVHFHDADTVDGKFVLLPIGKGMCDHRAAVRCLKSIEFDGYLSGEWSGWEPAEVHLPRELATMKSYESAARER